MLQFVQFARSYNITPSVLISANHSTTASGNLAPVHNGITTWIEVKHNALLLTTNHEIYAFVKVFPFCKVLPPRGEIQCFICAVWCFNRCLSHIRYRIRELLREFFYLLSGHFQFIKCCSTNKRLLLRKF